MENVLEAYSELCIMMKKFTDAMENAKLKLVYAYDDHEYKYTSARSLVHNSLELAPFLHPSIDEIVDKTLSTLQACEEANNLSSDPSYNSEPIPTRNDIYKIILSYFENNPILMNYVSGIIKNGIKYHTCHWKNTIDEIMNARGISHATRVRLTEHVLESGEIEINENATLKCYCREYDNVLKFINEQKEV